MILVTGAGGFIGRQVCPLLASHGEDVLAVDRAFPEPLPCPTAQGDIRDHAFLSSLFEQHPIQAVVHLATLLKTASRQQPDLAVEVNLTSSLALMDLAERSGVRRFLFSSSISAYGLKRAAQTGPVSEDEPAAPMTMYGVTKRCVEIAGEDRRRASGFPFTALRFAMVVGPGALNTVSMWRGEVFTRLRAAEPATIQIPFAPHDGLPLLHISDAAVCIERLLAAENPAHAIYNSPAENITAGELAGFVTALNPNIRFRFQPSPLPDEPEAVDGSRFSAEFGFMPRPVLERLRQAAESPES